MAQSAFTCCSAVTPSTSLFHYFLPLKLKMDAAAAAVDLHLHHHHPQSGALISALNWYRANTHPAHFAATAPQRPAGSLLLHIPVLGVWSTADSALLEPQMVASEAYVAPGCWRYERLEDVGHWMARDAPQQLNTLLLQFLGGGSCDGGGAGVGGGVGSGGKVQERTGQNLQSRL